MADGSDSWDAAWYALNYLPVVEDDTMIASREEIEQMTFEEYMTLPPYVGGWRGGFFW